MIMRVVPLSFAFLLLVTSRVGGFSSSRSSLVPQTAYPLIIAVSRDGTPHNICSGILIDENFILTAAQCVQYRNGVRILIVQAGNIIRSVTPDEVFVHPKFSRTLNNDLALIQVSNGSLLIRQKFKPFSISGRGFGRKETVILGYHDHIGWPANILKGKVRILSRRECLRYNPYMMDTEICATSNSEFLQNLGRRSDQFSSGSPLLIETRYNYEVIGIVSNKLWNRNKRCINILNIFYYKKWIESIINGRKTTSISSIPTNNSHTDTEVTEIIVPEVTEKNNESSTGTFVTATNPSENEVSGVTEFINNTRVTSTYTDDTDIYATDTVISIGETEQEATGTEPKDPVDIFTKKRESTETSAVTQYTNKYYPTEETELISDIHGVSKEAVDSDIITDDQIATKSAETSTKMIFETEYPTKEPTETSNDMNETNTIISTEATETNVIMEVTNADTSADPINVNNSTESSINTAFSESTLSTTINDYNSPGVQTAADKNYVTINATVNMDVTVPHEETLTPVFEQTTNAFNSFISTSEANIPINDLTGPTNYETENGTQAHDDENKKSSDLPETPLTCHLECDVGENQDVPKPILKIVVKLSPLEENSTQDDHNVHRVPRLFFPFGFADSISKNISFVHADKAGFKNSTFTLGSNTSLSVSVDIFPNLQKAVKETLKKIFGR